MNAPSLSKLAHKLERIRIKIIRTGISKENIFKFLMLLPYIWLSTGLLVFPDGDKNMIVMILIAVIATLYHRGLAPIKENLKHDKILWVLLALTIYALFSYFYHGISSREIRAFIGASLFLVCFPRELLTDKIIRTIIILGVIFCSSYAIYFSIILEHDRLWPINSIPYATMCATFGILAISQLSRTAPLNVQIQSALSLMFSLVAIILCETRGIWLGFSVAIVIILLLKVKNRGLNVKYALLGIIILLSIGFIAKPQIEKRIEQTQVEIKTIDYGNLDTSIGLRFQMWRLAPAMLEDHYILGWGRNHLLRFDELYQQGRISKELYAFHPAHYHNQYLDIFIKNGAVGLVFLLALLVVPMTQLKYTSIERKHKIIGIVTLFAIAALTDVPFNHGQTLFIYLLLICGIPSYSLSKIILNND